MYNKLKRQIIIRNVRKWWRTPADSKTFELKIDLRLVRKSKPRLSLEEKLTGLPQHKCFLFELLIKFLARLNLNTLYWSEFI